MAKAKNRDLEFLFEIGTLKNVDRGWSQFMGMKVGTILEHTMRVAFLALLIARKEGVKNEEKILKMALIHDLAETRVSDLAYVQKVYTHGDEERAAKDMFAGTIFQDLQGTLLMEYEKRESIEAKIVKDADNLDVDMELRELSDRGSKLADRFTISRKFIPKDKLYTKTAKKMWHNIVKADIHDWHVEANKWKKIPSAGK